MKIYTYATAALLAVLALLSCAPGAKEPAGPEAAPAEEFPAVERLPTTREFIAQRMNEQHSPLSSIYSVPESDLDNNVFVELYRGRKTAVLAENVETYLGNIESLAVAFENGVINVLGDWPCESLIVPGSEPGLIAWRPDSPVLAATEAERPVIHVYELLSCAEIAALEQPSRPALLSISRDGSRISVIDEVYDLWIGPSIGPLSKAARLRYAALDLQFSPQGGLVMVIDQLGWVTSWSAQNGERVRTAQIPGGPFETAEINGALIHISNFDGITKTWSITGSEFIEAEKPASPYKLENGILTYTEPGLSYLKRVHFGRPRLSAAYSKSSRVLRISDIDGNNRYYSLASGQKVYDAKAGDWEAVEIDPDGTVRTAGQVFRLADPIFQQDEWRLMARHTSDQTVYTWWIQAAAEPGGLPKPGVLPFRYGIKPDQLEWRRVFSVNGN